MTDYKRTITNLVGIKVTEDFFNDVVCAFDTTENEVLIYDPETNDVARKEDDGLYYAQPEGEKGINFKIGNGVIVDAWYETDEGEIIEYSDLK